MSWAGYIWSSGVGEEVRAVVRVQDEKKYAKGEIRAF
jgi:hypothetical protein